MNTYRITITTMREPDHESRVLQFDVDALRPNTAIVYVLNDSLVSFFEPDLHTITSELYAENIFPMNDKTVRKIVA